MNFRIRKSPGSGQIAIFGQNNLKVLVNCEAVLFGVDFGSSPHFLFTNINSDFPKISKI